ncbi:MAG: hypothetical protein JWQ38_3066 [Flavipsychrobacter sp.]|nr:hypothetical protein [Flavipsychrobacter sp.]
MTRFHIGFVFLLLYAVWIIYRGLVKKDIRQHKDAFYLYTILIAVWALIYFWFFFEEITHIVSS